MEKAAGSRSKNAGRKLARLLGLTFLSAFIFSAVVAMRHMLDTPRQLESPLPVNPIIISGSSVTFSIKCWERQKRQLCFSSTHLN